MTHAEQHKIIIVGGGPAGLGAALHLTRRMPWLVDELLVIEAATYPRQKVCGGGVTFHGEEQLRDLDIEIDVPSFHVHRLVFRLGRQAFSATSADAMRIIQRKEFDAALARAVVTRGLHCRTGERVLDLIVREDGVTLVTAQGTYTADVVIGADGANSVVRQKLQLPAAAGVARLLRAMTPIEPTQTTAWQEHTAVFDFSCVLQGIQGYAWDFPCYVDGRPFMNRGIFDSRIEPEHRQPMQHGALKQAFTAGLNERQVDMHSFHLEGHPVRWFNPRAEFARPRVLLAGDAAGVDPLFAEGISYAMEYGVVIAAMVEEAFARRDFAFRNYRERLLHHRLGQSLKRRAAVARHLYRHQWPQFWSAIWQLASISPAVIKHAIGSSLDVLPAYR